MTFTQSGNSASASISGTYNDIGRDQINKNHNEIKFSPTINDNKKTVNNNLSRINENVENMTINYGGNTTNSFVDNSFRSIDDHSKHENVVSGVSSPTPSRAISQDSHVSNDASSVPHPTSIKSPSQLLRAFHTWTAPSDTDASQNHTISHGLEEARTMIKGLWKHHKGSTDHNTAHNSLASGTQAAPDTVAGTNVSRFTKKQLDTGKTKHENELELELASLKMADDVMKERLRGNTGNTIINYGGNTNNVCVDNSTETMNNYSTNQTSIGVPDYYEDDGEEEGGEERGEGEDEDNDDNGDGDGDY